MNPAHWSRVTKEISRRYGLDYKTAKQVFDKLRATEGRTPSLRMVSRLPDRLPRELKPKVATVSPKAPAKAAKAPAKARPEAKAPAPTKPPQTRPRTARPKAQRSAPPPPPQAQREALEASIAPRRPGGPDIRLAPAPTPRPRGVAREVPARQGARNKFEDMLRDRGLPVAAIARQGAAKDLVRLWRDEKLQTRAADLLAKAYREIKTSRKGEMRSSTKNQVHVLFRQIAKNNPDRAKILYHAILKQLYGR